MDEHIARRLIQSYLDGWKQLDLSLVLSSLSKKPWFFNPHAAGLKGPYGSIPSRGL